MTKSANDKVGDFLEDFTSGVVRDPFMLYEPWDVEEREEWLYAEAERKHVDLRSPDVEQLYGGAPHEFQTGYLLDRTFTSAIFGGNQIGKSYAGLMDMLIMMTGEKPYSLRYKKGEDTGIRREVSKENIRRFGRRCLETGKTLDYDDSKVEDGTWNCGNIMGVGVYPDAKIAPKGQKAWLGTFAQAKDEYWWKRLKEFLPDYLIDRNRGNQGFAERKGIVYLSNGCEIHVITYEQGYERFEAENVWVILLDEEPPDQRVFTSAIQHISIGGVGVRLIETPYRGVTWTYEYIIKRSLESKDVKIFHATQYDSPYQDRKRIKMKMALMKPWEIESRVFGMHSEQKGRPYFDRERINRWLRSHNPMYKLYTFEPTRVWQTVHDVMRGSVRANQVFEKEERSEWEIYEEVDRDTAYWMTCDTGQGSTEAEDAQDRNCAHIFRAPKARLNENMSLPVIVASCRSSETTINFARMCVYACRHYNNCLLAPESKGETASTFISEIRDYPFMFTMTLINDKTKKPTEHIGFDTNVRTRRRAFDLIGDFLNEVDQEYYPNIPHFYTLKELAELVVGKRGRPDHPNGGTSDCAVAFGIGLYIWAHAKEQIRNNYGYTETDEDDKDSLDSWGGRVNKTNERRRVLGSKRGLDERAGTHRVR